ncbi:hypothetical protein ACFFMM_04185 [Micromonospora chaiyaphumensis]|uniref:AMP-binding enzyme n=1 Tax=Micromonospora chaiyaphumensis TaxID=307119 RepID=A0A1C4ZAU3_9ACTN|nr:hypothetical protein [Micromonospora chaiyaphumensis]SCF30095.1 hypothetical protein GA0070214_11312 [Micromonospora chaiyaphumensis]
MRSTDPTAPTVTVLGDPGRIAGLARRLSTAWRVRHTASLDHVQPGELVLLVHPVVAAVARTRRALPAGCALAVLVPGDADTATIADVLLAGADVCVRDGSTAILAGHLVACHRRLSRAPSPGVDRDPVPAGARPTAVAR